jgi:nitrile hydratase accessory protein
MAADPGWPGSLPPPSLPGDASGPAFRESWEAQAFALAVALYQAGHFTWSEWVAAISAEIRRAQAEGDPDLGNTYYRHWLAALEKIVVAKTLADDVDLRLRRIECAANPPGRHNHPARREPIKVG